MFANDFDISFFSFPPGTEMFHFPGCASRLINSRDPMNFRHRGFPHSDIAGSKVARHLPDA